MIAGSNTVSSRSRKARSAPLTFMGPVRACLWAFCAVMVSLIPRVEAGTLKGCVLGSDGSPKAHVTVEILAAGRIQVEQTGADGCFSTSLRNGRYVIRVRESRRRQDFNVEVGSGGASTTFKVRW